MRAFAAALDGHLPRDDEWDDVLRLANQGWLVPALCAALDRAGRLDEVPEAAQGYLRLLRDRNSERNSRLSMQLLEAVEAFNRAGIQPILTKGAINLFVDPPELIGDRMTSDIDIAVEPNEFAASEAVLTSIGYSDIGGTGNMGRAQDVGSIDLHTRPKPLSRGYLAGDLKERSELHRRNGVSAWIPSPTARAQHLIAHDVFKEGEYWRLTLDLRHLRDLLLLARAEGGIDWGELCGIFSDRIGRQGLALQAMAMRELFNFPIPEMLDTRGLRTRHRIRMTAASSGPAGSLARLAGRLSWMVERFGRGYRWTGIVALGRQVRRALLEPGKGPRERI